MSIQIRQPPSTSPDRSIVVSGGSDGELQALRREYERNHCVRLQGLFEPALLERIRREVDAADFSPRETDLKRELCIEPGRAIALLMFIANDPALFEAVRAITGCERIGCFEGRVYRMLPGAGHSGDRHSDVIDHRMVAMSVNLGDVPYSGAVLEIRDGRSGEVLQRIANTGPGETVLFHIARGLEHRVTPLEGTVTKTACVGFFASAPESLMMARKNRFVEAARTEA